MENIELAPVGPADHVRGPSDAPITLVEYADFECPYCRAAASIVAEVERAHAGRLRFVFRQFPLRDIHPHAETAAEAAEAAGAQGKFWEMHEALFAPEHDRALSAAAVRQTARAIGLPDVARFDRELEAHHYRPAIDAAIVAGEDSGVEGTPMFFINGQPFAEEPSIAAFEAAFAQVQPARH